MKMNIKMTVRAECDALARAFHKYENQLCKTRYSYNYKGIVGNYINTLAIIAEIQGKHFDQAKAYGYLRSYHKQSTAQKAMQQIQAVYQF